MALHTYLPQDRLRALSLGLDLPERTRGTALFADISGFTRLTESLTHQLGARRGVEVVSARISEAYEALIGAVERHGGSVIGFAGDAITCWFDAGLAGDPRTAAQQAGCCALAMQTALGACQGLSVKVALSSGTARRFVVGDPAHQRIDVLAGATLDRMAAIEHQAQPGEVLVDAASAALLGMPDAGADAVQRLLPALLPAPLQAAPMPDSPPAPALPPAERLRPWVLPFVQQREQALAAEFATDLRPAAVLFLRFGGLDYDGDETAAARLDALIRRAQQLLHAHQGLLLELTVGDKGSYLLASFGADQVHEDDGARAVRAALALRAAWEGPPPQCGLSHGLLRVGAYGSSTRRSFGAMGDDTNAAARLMQIAQPGEILVSARLRTQLAQAFLLEARPPLPLKGKGEPMLVFAVLGVQQQRAIGLQEPANSLPMVGRDAERAYLEQALRDAAQGQGRVIAVVAEAGMGKSRLLAEGVRLARRAGFQGFGASCLGSGLAEPYRLWHRVLQALFDLDPSQPQRRSIRQLSLQLEEHAPEHVDAWPVLGAALGIELPDNDFTRGLQAKDRKTLLETLLLRCLTGTAREAAEEGGGLLLVLEDLHAIDTLSLSLLRLLCQAVTELPVLLLLSQRSEAPLPRLPHLQTLQLTGLSGAKAEQLIRAKLAVLYPERVGSIAANLIERVAQRAQGNPFYLEELLGYLHDRGHAPQLMTGEALLELPTSLHSLVLSRIDQLTRPQQQLLKVASVIGRRFRAAEPAAFYPALGEADAVRGDLEALDQQGFLSDELDAEEPSYQFRQLITQEVGYESMPFATRARLHGLYADYLTANFPERREALAGVLAHHYACAEQPDKAWPHLLQAGVQAQARFANEEALALFERALASLPASRPDARFDLLLRTEALLDLLGEHERQRAVLTELFARAEAEGQPRGLAEVNTRLAKLEIDLGRYSQAEAAGARAAEAARGQQGLEPLHADALLLLARTRFQEGRSAEARPPMDEALALARRHGYRRGEYNTLAQLGLLHWQQGDHEAAERLLADALALTRAAGDLRREMDMLNNLGVVAKTRGRHAQAVAHYEAAQRLARRIGDRLGEASLSSNIASACLVCGDFEQALQQAEAAARVFEGVDEPAQHGMALVNWAEALRELGQPAAALPLAEQALARFRACGLRRGEAIVLENLGLLARAQGQGELALERLRASLQCAEAIGLHSVQTSAQVHLAEALTAAGQLDAAAGALAQAQALAQHEDDALLRLEWAAAEAELALARGEARALPALLWDALLQPAGLPLRLHATALRVLQAQEGQGARAAQLQALAQAELQARSQRIQRGSLRESFLALPAHRALQGDAA